MDSNRRSEKSPLLGEQAFLGGTDIDMALYRQELIIQPSIGFGSGLKAMKRILATLPASFLGFLSDAVWFHQMRTRWGLAAAGDVAFVIACQLVLALRGCSGRCCLGGTACSEQNHDRRKTYDKRSFHTSLQVNNRIRSIGRCVIGWCQISYRRGCGWRQGK